MIMQRALFAAFLAFLVVISLLAPASAQAPLLLPIQGYLSDPDTGLPIDGLVEIRFRLYPDAEGAMPPLFEEIVTATVQEGELVVYLGESVPIDLALFRDTDSVYVGAQIGGDPEGRPLVRLATAPFAAYARYCGDAETLGGLTSGQLRDFDRLVNVPTEFPPAPHSHADDEGFASGTYIPSFSAVDGEPAPTFGEVFEHGYLRVGSTVSVWGAVEITPAIAGRNTFRISAPLPADIKSVNEARGPVSAAAEQFQGGGTYGDAEYDQIRVRFYVGTTAKLNVTYSFQYQVD